MFAMGIIIICLVFGVVYGAVKAAGEADRVIDKWRD